ncbi:dephospho-CoA kinase [Chitinophaga skermanii]|uniref:Dephospho-CoA kinase n=1 Tax=Chitinophaga skermanii TaxID=331697 RepID=A0A327QE33_9BACT|nr:dephospho-CoA kinase [Chitinophaga skermanii]RAJ02265.1 dephospho-CoA kinase [Chitinophaga skermanii]
MRIIGLTGGIGSGKSTVAKIFEVLGIPVYYADTAAKNIMETDPQLVSQIRDYFGGNAYDDQGKLNRKYIANIVFHDQEQLDVLNSLVHPATIRDSERWAKEQNAPYVLKEAALLFESESFHHTDKVITVFAPEVLRIHRVMQRDGVSRNDVYARMYKQMDENIKKKLADYVIYNDEQQAVIPQVLAIHEQLLKG